MALSIVQKGDLPLNNAKNINDQFNALITTTDRIRDSAAGTCSTAAGTAAKIVTLNTGCSWTLEPGATITVKFSYTNTASSPTLNVNGTGAKPIWYNTAQITNSNLAMAGTASLYIEYVYDGTYYVFIGKSADTDTNTTYTNASLGQGYATCSTAADTATKVATLSNYSLQPNGIVAVKFTYTVPASATLNVNSQGAKSIYYQGAVITDGIINAGDTAIFIYDGTQYQLIAKDNYTKSDVGLDNVTNDAQVKRSEMGVANGVATLDSDGKVPKSMLPDSGTSISGATITLTNSNTYDGSVKTQNVTVSLNGVTLQENKDYVLTGNTATNAGSYTLLIIGSGDYTGAITKTWTINKLTSTISLDKTSVSIKGATGTTDTVTVTTNSDGAITAISSDISVATVSVNNNSVIVTSAGNGSCTITVTVNATSNCIAATASISAKIVKSLSVSTWEEINSAGKAGTASSLWEVGDEKTITLTTGEEVTFVIMGFAHDDLADGSGKAPISFGMKNLLATTYPMNSSNTNVGGWDQSLMRTDTLETIYSQLPTDLKEIIKPVLKKASAGNQSTDITTSTDKLWLFSIIEIIGSSTSPATSVPYSNEGEQYEYYKSVVDGTVAANRIKYLSNGAGNANYYWLRSPSAADAASFRDVSSSGSVSRYSASGAIGVAFGLCI
jgi:hypothetical protein